MPKPDVDQPWEVITPVLLPARLWLICRQPASLCPYNRVLSAKRNTDYDADNADEGHCRVVIPIPTSRLREVG